MKLLWCSDNVILPTGYANQTRNLLFRFKMSGWDVSHLAFHFTHPHMPNPTETPINYNVYFPVDIKNESYGNMGSIEQAVNSFKPDITAFLCDSFMIEHLLEKRIQNENNQDIITKKYEQIKKIGTKLLFYFPFDSNEAYAGSEKVMEIMDIRVAMSKFAQKVLKRDTGLDSHVIPHGTDPITFRPLSSKIKETLKEQNKWTGKFVIGSVARNQSRKMHPVLFEAFSRFHKDVKDSILFMHCDPKDSMGWDLNELSKKMEIQDSTIFSMQRFDVGNKEPYLNSVYNAMDIHVLSSSGEGFGIPIIESMAAGTPNICIDYTTSKEILDDTGELVKVNQFIYGQKNTRRALPDVDDMYKKICKLYDNPKLRERHSKRGRERVLKHFTWEKVVPMWQQLLEHGQIYDRY